MWPPCVIVIKSGRLCCAVFVLPFFVLYQIRLGFVLFSAWPELRLLLLLGQERERDRLGWCAGESGEGVRWFLVVCDVVRGGALARAFLLIYTPQKKTQHARKFCVAFPRERLTLARNNDEERRRRRRLLLLEERLLLFWHLNTSRLRGREPTNHTPPPYLF